MASQPAEFILVEVCFTSDTHSLSSLILRWLEPRLVPLLALLEPKCFSKPLLWQNRYVGVDNRKDAYYHVFYAISFESNSDTIASILKEYERYIEAQPMFRDNSHSLWVSIKHAERSKMPPTILAHDDWLTVEAMAPADKDIPDDFDATTDEGQISQHPASYVDASYEEDPITSAVRKKFRTEREVMNRIRHDPDFSIDNFLVGYEDRFTGIMEMPLSSWKLDTTEDEFIPLHRVTHFRRKDTLKIVWDRHRRIDLIFR